MFFRGKSPLSENQIYRDLFTSNSRLFMTGPPYADSFKDLLKTHYPKHEMAGGLLFKL